MEIKQEKLTITVYGAGYVGLVTAACLAKMGYSVLCVDVNAQRIAELQTGHVAIYEPGLSDLIQETMANQRLRFSSDIPHGVNFGLLQFIAVGTPQAEDGSADLRYIYAVAEQISRYRTEYCVIINKSTVPVGTADMLSNYLAEASRNAGKPFDYTVVSNPEFLKEGSAIFDFMQPDRIVIGTQDETAIQLMRLLYQPFVSQGFKLLNMDTRSAELTKYAANAMLATKISFINEMSQIAERLGADIEHIRQGISLDLRIGPHFINPGCGYGGSCFPKDVKALSFTAQQVGLYPKLLQSVDSVNQNQKQLLFWKIQRYFKGELQGKVVAVWGLAFKPNTNDIREAASLDLINALLSAGAIVQAYDPVAMPETAACFSQQANFSIKLSATEALQGADILAIVTEWQEFKNYELRAIKDSLSLAVIFDGRNLYEPETLKQLGIKYFAIGRGDNHEFYD
jgi:UDPglucose 6-dehydrogenase